MKSRLKYNSTRTSDDLSDFEGEMKIIATRRIIVFLVYFFFFAFFDGEISAPASDNPLVNNEPLNPSVGVVMTIIGDFHRQE